MATKQQIAKIAATIVEFQEEFASLPTEHGQWIIQHGKEAISLLVKTVIDYYYISPFIPKSDNWKIEEHKKTNISKLNLKKISLFLYEKGAIDNDLRKQLLFGSDVLDYLFINQELIPKDWESKKNILFLGTTYKTQNGFVVVRVLSWSGFKWFIDFIPADIKPNHPHYVAIMN